MERKARKQLAHKLRVLADVNQTGTREDVSIHLAANFTTEALRQAADCCEPPDPQQAEAALEEIAGMEGMTLLGADSNSPGVTGAPRMHEIGSHKAFNQCAQIAREALSRMRGLEAGK